jgi:hypothetical protein
MPVETESALLLYLRHALSLSILPISVGICVLW